MILSEHDNEQLRKEIIKKYGEDAIFRFDFINEEYKDERKKDINIEKKEENNVIIIKEKRFEEKEYFCEKCGKTSKFSTYTDTHYMKTYGVCFECKRGK